VEEGGLTQKSSRPGVKGDRGKVGGGARNVEMFEGADIRGAKERSECKNLEN